MPNGLLFLCSNEYSNTHITYAVRCLSISLFFFSPRYFFSNDCALDHRVMEAKWGLHVTKRDSNAPRSRFTNYSFAICPSRTALLDIRVAIVMTLCVRRLCHVPVPSWCTMLVYVQSGTEGRLLERNIPWLSRLYRSIPSVVEDHQTGVSSCASNVDSDGYCADKRGEGM